MKRIIIPLWKRRQIENNFRKKNIQSIYHEQVEITNTKWSASSSELQATRDTPKLSKVMDKAHQ